MLAWALIFFVVALIAGLLGFTGLMALTMGVAKIIFFVFLVLFILSIIIHIISQMDVSIAQNLKGRSDMLGWVLTFLVIALIAGLLGFTGLMTAAAGIAKVLFYIFLILFVASLIMHLIRRSNLP